MKSPAVRVASQIMTREVAIASPQWTLAELGRVLCERRVSGLPVVEKKTLVGVVSSSDLIRRSAVERSRAGEISDYFRGYDLGPDEQIDSLVAEEQAVARRITSTRVADVMSPPAFVVVEATPIRDVAKLLVTHRIHRVPVVSDGELVGIVSSLDLIDLIASGSYR